jgi:ATP-dependent helicase HrpB
VTELPIRAAIGAVRSALADRGAAVLVATPGAGKTTVVPLELLAEPWLGGRKIALLEPRRLAARAAAGRLATNHGTPLGGTVGYRIRFDTRVSARTRIEVVTEGVLPRLLDADPALEDYGLVIFDEFHERSLFADVGLALALETRAVLRPDLRILVMSATIDPVPVAGLLGGGGPAPVIEAPGRMFPVETRYRPPRTDRRLEGSVASVVREAVASDPGDVLVFLPGAGEIRRVEDLLADPANPLPARVLPLHGSLPAGDQDAALAPGGDRRVVLATSIAETSLTIPGVRIVIDAGLMRVARFSPRTGMSRLETVRVSRSSADQRRGRAGRTEPGVCYRLWAAADEAGLVDRTLPEILSSDLASLALDLAVVHGGDPAALAWLDPPPAPALAQARALLQALGALDSAGAVTAEGRAMARLPLHPRIAHVVVRAKTGGEKALAAEIAAILGERDVIRRGAGGALADVDLRLRLDAVRGDPLPLGIELDRALVQRLRQETREWRRRLGVAAEQSDSTAVGDALLWAYPDRIAQRRPGQAGRYLLRSGRGASFPADQPLAREDFLVAVELDDAGSESRISLAVPVGADRVARLAEETGSRRQIVEWDDAAGEIRAVERLELGALILAERPIDPDREVATRVALEAIHRRGVAGLPWTDRALGLRRRLAFLHRLDPGRWAEPTDAALLERVGAWLGPRIGSARRIVEIVGSIDLERVLLEGLSHDRRAELDRLAPERFATPAGSSLGIDYADPGSPVVRVRLQELFGLARTPTVGGGAVPLTLELLSPAHRPVQITRDLAGFWRTSYHDMRKDLKGRYPKHEWPENPLAAAPTRRAKPRR